nr:MAG TPA: hypothetical protein [Caudoviricetes sp.]DAJ36369.1 MAG TPA: hypothetical protein [Bacteriophage sp.]DAO21833.1 MAG TPA: hypothetical protein [Caudoviricetes sp.]
MLSSQIYLFLFSLNKDNILYLSKDYCCGDFNENRQRNIGF